MLHRAAKEEGCRSIALGHHRDEAAETFLMNLLEGGTLSCFSPKSYLSNRDLYLIRPLLFLSEKQASAARGYSCRWFHRLSRRWTDQPPADQELIARLSQTYGPVDAKILTALQKSGLSGGKPRTSRFFFLKAPSSRHASQARYSVSESGWPQKADARKAFSSP